MTEPSRKADDGGKPRASHASAGRPTPAQRAYLGRGLDQPGGKLPLFDSQGQRYDPRIIRACIDHGWATPWFANPMKPDWLVCRLTDAGRAVLAERPVAHARRKS